MNLEKELYENLCKEAEEFTKRMNDEYENEAIIKELRKEKEAEEITKNQKP